MAGHSQFKNIQFRKGAQDKKRAKLFTKLIKEITTAASAGGTDPHANPKLRSALASARAQNLPKERIDKALNPSSTQDNYHEIRYEGFTSGGFPVIVEALTDNKNRTAGEVRAAFTKYGGKLGENGSVSFMFDHVGIIEYDASKFSAEAILDAVLEIDALDVISDEITHTIYTTKEQFHNCLEQLSDKFGMPNESSIGWRPHEYVVISNKEQAEKIIKLITVLEDLDDIQYVYGNYEFSSEILNELEKNN